MQAPAMLPGDVRANLAYGLEAPQEAELRDALADGLAPALLDHDARDSPAARRRAWLSPGR